MRDLGPCRLCDEYAVQLHHVTGRDADGNYLDPEFVAPLCAECHQIQSDDWYAAGVPDRRREGDDQSRIELRLRRMGLFLGRLAIENGDPLSALIADHCARWALELDATSPDPEGGHA